MQVKRESGARYLMETTSRLHVIHVLQSVHIGSSFLVRPHPNCFHEGDAVYSNRKVHSNRRSVGAAGAALAMCAAIGLTACSSSEAETAKLNLSNQLPRLRT